MKKTPEELQAALDREIAYSAKLNEAHIQREYDQKLLRINLQQPKIYNEY